MTNAEKANIYDECLRESDQLQREISKMKSDFVGNIPLNIEILIEQKKARIDVLVRKLESLFN